MELDSIGKYKIEYSKFIDLLGSCYWKVVKDTQKNDWPKGRYLKYIDGLYSKSVCCIEFYVDSIRDDTIQYIDVIISPRIKSDKEEAVCHQIQFAKFMQNKNKDEIV